MLEEGVITTSWNSHKAVNVEDNATVFSLTFTATATANISDIVSINSRYTQAEAYNGSDLYNVALAFNGAVATFCFIPKYTKPIQRCNDNWLQLASSSYSNIECI